MRHRSGSFGIHADKPIGYKCIQFAMECADWQSRQRCARQIHAIIGDSIFGGTNISELVKSVKAILDKQLVRYATTYVNTSRAKFIQMMQYEAARNYDGELFWIYEGPEDDVTRPVCREGTGMDVNAMFPNAPYFTEEERIEFESYSAPERTYECRHSFMQITKEYYYDHVR